MLNVGALWPYDRQLRRVIPAVREQRSIAVLVGSKQLARIQGDDAQGRVTEAMFSLPEGDDNVAADARHTIDVSGLKAVVEVPGGGGGRARSLYATPPIPPPPPGFER